MKELNFLIILILIPILNAQTNRGTFGDFCDTRTRCDSRANLACANGFCQCIKEGEMVFDERKGKCVVLSGERCSFSNAAKGNDKSVDRDRERDQLECVEHAYCSEDGFCTCVQRYFESAQGQCTEKQVYGGTCSRQSECSGDRTLICLNGRCGCNETEAIYDTKTKQCLGRVGSSCSLYSKCVNNAACPSRKDSTSRNSRWETDTCKCAKGYAKGSDGLCYGLFDFKCDPVTSPCAIDFTCVDEVCKCPFPEHQTHDKELQRCVSAVNGPCAEKIGGRTVNFPCPKNAECRVDNGFAECLCAPGYIESFQGRCEPIYGSPCRRSWECDSSARLICKNGTCGCRGLQEYDKEFETCRGRVGAKCDTELKNFCVNGAHCQPSRAHKNQGTCRCNHKFETDVVKRRCVPIGEGVKRTERPDSEDQEAAADRWKAPAGRRDGKRPSDEETVRTADDWPDGGKPLDRRPKDRDDRRPVDRDDRRNGRSDLDNRPLNKNDVRSDDRPYSRDSKGERPMSRDYDRRDDRSRDRDRDRDDRDQSYRDRDAVRRDEDYRTEPINHDRKDDGRPILREDGRRDGGGRRDNPKSDRFREDDRPRKKENDDAPINRDADRSNDGIRNEDRRPTKKASRVGVGDNEEEGRNRDRDRDDNLKGDDKDKDTSPPDDNDRRKDDDLRKEEAKKGLQNDQRNKGNSEAKKPKQVGPASEEDAPAPTAPEQSGGAEKTESGMPVKSKSREKQDKSEHQMEKEQGDFTSGDLKEMNIEKTSEYDDIENQKYRYNTQIRDRDNRRRNNGYRFDDNLASQEKQQRPKYRSEKDFGRPSSRSRNDGDRSKERQVDRDGRRRQGNDIPVRHGDHVRNQNNDQLRKEKYEYERSPSPQRDKERKDRLPVFKEHESEFKSEENLKSSESTKNAYEYTDYRDSKEGLDTEEEYRLKNRIDEDRRSRADKGSSGKSYPAGVRSPSTDENGEERKNENTEAGKGTPTEREDHRKERPRPQNSNERMSKGNDDDDRSIIRRKDERKEDVRQTSGERDSREKQPSKAGSRDGGVDKEGKNDDHDLRPIDKHDGIIEEESFPTHKDGDTKHDRYPAKNDESKNESPKETNDASKENVPKGDRDTKHERRPTKAGENSEESPLSRKNNAPKEDGDSYPDRESKNDERKKGGSERTKDDLRNTIIAPAIPTSTTQAFQIQKAEESVLLEVGENTIETVKDFETSATETETRAEEGFSTNDEEKAKKTKKDSTKDTEYGNNRPENQGTESSITFSVGLTSTSSKNLEEKENFLFDELTDSTTFEYVKSGVTTPATVPTTRESIERPTKIENEVESEDMQTTSNTNSAADKVTTAKPVAAKSKAESNDRSKSQKTETTENVGKKSEKRKPSGDSEMKPEEERTTKKTKSKKSKKKKSSSKKSSRDTEDNDSLLGAANLAGLGRSHDYVDYDESTPETLVNTTEINSSSEEEITVTSQAPPRGRNIEGLMEDDSVEQSKVESNSTEVSPTDSTIPSQPQTTDIWSGTTTTTTVNSNISTNSLEEEDDLETSTTANDDEFEIAEQETESNLSSSTSSQNVFSKELESSVSSTTNDEMENESSTSFRPETTLEDDDGDANTDITTNAINNNAGNETESLSTAVNPSEDDDNFEIENSEEKLEEVVNTLASIASKSVTVTPNTAYTADRNVATTAKIPAVTIANSIENLRKEGPEKENRVEGRSLGNDLTEVDNQLIDISSKATQTETTLGPKTDITNETMTTTPNFGLLGTNTNKEFAPEVGSTTEISAIENSIEDLVNEGPEKENKVEGRSTGNLELPPTDHQFIESSSKATKTETTPGSTMESADVDNTNKTTVTTPNFGLLGMDSTTNKEFVLKSTKPTPEETFNRTEQMQTTNSAAPQAN